MIQYTMKKEEKTKLWNYYGTLPAINDLFESIANKYGMNFYEHSKFNSPQFRTNTLDDAITNPSGDYLVIWFNICFKYSYRLGNTSSSGKLDDNFTPQQVEEFIEAYLKQSKEYKIKQNLEEINKDFE